MGLLGTLRVKLGMDVKDFTDGLKSSMAKLSKTTKSMKDTVAQDFKESGASIGANMAVGLDQARSSMLRLTATAQSVAKDVSRALQTAIPPGGFIPPRDTFNGATPDSTSIIKSIVQITEYITKLKEMGLISQTVGAKMQMFAQVLYSMGYGVDTIRSYIDRIISVFTQAGASAEAASAGVNHFRDSIKRLGEGSAVFSAAAGDTINASYTIRDAFTGAQESAAGFAQRTKSGFTGFKSTIKNTGAAFSSFAGKVSQGFNNLANSSAGFAKKTKSNFKDISRIAQGIIVSQIFYRTINAVKSATQALAEFVSQTEQARVAFSIMFRDTGLADRFMKNIEDFAARTPYTFQQAADNARKLIAYGFQAANLGPIMDTLADAASASGDSETFNRVGKALGQIRTKGRLASQELLQLTEAGIPAFEILRQKLKLTSDQMANIGRLKIPADIAIQAILQGMQERYGGAAQAMSNTVSGMLSTIKDNALIIGKNAFEPMYYSFKNTLTKIRDLSDSWRGLARTGGSGGILRNIFTQDTFAKIQLFSSNLRMLRQNFILLWLVLKPVLTTALQFGLTIFNMVLPPINALVRGVLLLAQWITSCGTAVKYFLGAFSAIFIAAWAAQILLHFGMVIRKLFIVKALAQVIIGLAKAIRVLALTIVASPWIGILVLAAGALLYLGLTSKKVSGWLTGLGSSLNKAFGADPSKEFNTKIKQTTGTTNEFNKKLAVSKESLDKMGDSAKDAAKKAKDALASFDEVFTLPEPKDEDSTGLDAGELDNINPTIPAIEIPEPELPNMDTSISAWVNNLKTTLLQKLKNALLGAGIGAAIGAVFGGILGGPGGAALGAKIGAAAGAIAGFFWDQLPTRIKTSVKTAGIGAGIGFVLGGIMGGPGGAAIGGALGALAGGIVGYFWDEIKKQFTQSVSIGAGVGAVVGTVVGTAFGGPLGGAIGAALGIAIGALVGHFWEDIKKFFTTSTGKGALAGAGVGSIIGTAFGGPLGFAIGGILGGIIGALVGRFWEDIKKFFNGSTGKGASAGAVVGGVVGLAFGGPLGAAIGAILGGIIGGLVGKFWKDILKFFSDTKIKFNNWVEDVSTSVLGKFGRTLEKIRTIWNNIVKIKDKIIEMKSIGPLDLSGLGLNLGGHASGGVFNKEHIARFAEGNKAEAIIPLENDNAMEPFVKAVASGVGAALAPLMVQQDNTSGDTSGSQQVLYVGTLIADDRGLRELDRRMRVIKLEEDRRR